MKVQRVLLRTLSILFAISLSALSDGFAASCAESFALIRTNFPANPLAGRPMKDSLIASIELQYGSALGKINETIANGRKASLADRLRKFLSIRDIGRGLSGKRFSDFFNSGLSAEEKALGALYTLEYFKLKDKTFSAHGAHIVLQNLAIGDRELAKRVIGLDMATDHPNFASYALTKYRSYLRTITGGDASADAVINSMPLPSLLNIDGTTFNHSLAESVLMKASSSGTGELSVAIRQRGVEYLARQNDPVATIALIAHSRNANMDSAVVGNLLEQVLSVSRDWKALNPGAFAQDVTAILQKEAFKDDANRNRILAIATKTLSSERETIHSIIQVKDEFDLVVKSYLGNQPSQARVTVAIETYANRGTAELTAAAPYVLSNLKEEAHLGFTYSIRDRVAPESLRAVFDRLRPRNASASPGVELKNITASQDQVEWSLLDQTLRTVERVAGTTLQSPSEIAKAVAAVPVQWREIAVKAMLHKACIELVKCSALIAALNPDAETGRALATNFRDSSKLLQNAKEQQFSDEQLRAMFGGDRLHRFFPWTAPTASLQTPAPRLLFKPSKYNEANRSNLILAVYSQPHSDLPADWIRFAVRQVDEPSSALGFVGGSSHAFIKNEVLSESAGKRSDFPSQIRGLIVQGQYEVDGLGLMTKQLSRGDDQVESTLPALVKRADNSLRRGALKREPEIVQRLFVKHWVPMGSSSQIESIRQKALDIVKIDPAFYPLRVEVHNFPNFGVLTAVKKYRNALSVEQSSVWKELDVMIGDIESLIGARSDSGTNFDSVLSSLPNPYKKSEHSHLAMDLGWDISQRALVDRTDLLTVVTEGRKKWRTGFDTKMRARKLSAVESVRGDLQISDAAMAAASKAIESSARIDSGEQLARQIKLANQIMENVTYDGMLSAAQMKTITHEVDLVASSNLPLENKAELILDLYQNVVDQVHTMLVREFGDHDQRLFHLMKSPATKPTHFVDATMRSQNIFMLSQLIDKQHALLRTQQGIRHSVLGKEVDVGVEVYNRGDATGTLRFNPNPSELTKDDIAVFTEMPPESNPVGGFITMGVGARLSHLQLLAKSLGIPNVRAGPELVDVLEALNGKRIRMRADKQGSLRIEEASPLMSAREKASKDVKIPVPSYGIRKPVSFSQLLSMGTDSTGIAAGPKGINLARLASSRKLKDHVPDGSVLTFGFFREYVKQAGLTDLISTLGKTKLENTNLIRKLSDEIIAKIEKTPVSAELRGQILREMQSLEKRTSHQGGYFVRSDTNIEDLPGFNGAGINESVPNVSLSAEKLDAAVRRVWQSAFREKSIFWRAMALRSPTVTIAEPSVVLMPTIRARSSGVILTTGASSPKSASSRISANWGIGSVVESNTAVEEIVIQGKRPFRSSFTTSTQKPVASLTGGLHRQSVAAGQPVLSDSQVTQLMELSSGVEQHLGPQPYGWDIEWAIDESGKPWILQARPNTAD